MSKEITLSRPEPIIPGKIALFNHESSIDEVITELQAGREVLISGVFNNGTTLLKELQLHLDTKFSNTNYQEQRAYRSAYHKLSNLILVEIVGHKINLEKSPEIGWLEKLYPTTPDFYLSLPQVQGMNSSWQWYQNGISIPVLRNKLHPYYGVYFPTRFDHLILFDNWLKRYDGLKKTAIDVGVGSGILSYQLIEHGFQKVFATDINPNAIIGMKEAMGDTKLSRKIELDFAPLFGCWDKPTELIVFNPPWLPTDAKVEFSEEAMYYNENLFPGFFEAAKSRLLPDGKLLILFSNLAQLMEITKTHPVAHEIETGGRFQLEKCLKRPVRAASENTTRDQNWRAKEEVELWILTHKI